jgi:hypothetical protein
MLKSWKLIAALAASAILVAAAWMGWQWFAVPKLPEGILE